jgi:hypothetical protein
MSEALTIIEHDESPAQDTGLVSRTTIREIVAYRDAAITKMAEALDTLSQGYALADEALDLATIAHRGASFHLKNRSEQDAYSRIFQGIDTKASFEVYRQATDAHIWMHLVNVTGIDKMMDKTARDKLYDDLCGDVPPVTEENAYAMFKSLMGDAELIFQRGLARAFSDLDRRFKSHDGFKVGSRIVLTNVFNDWGSWNYHSRMEETMADIERVFAVLDKAEPDPNGLRQAISADRSGWGAKQSVTETRYFRVKGFKNGNAHIWFKRDDLVTKANQILAKYYGEVLPDAAPHPDEVKPEDLKSKGGALSKELQFYPTPTAVIEAALYDLYLKEGVTVLEPSAGTGNIVRHLLDNTKVKHVTSIEVDSQRASQIPTGPRSAVVCGNFLTERPTASFDHVIMNPPFFGTHWMQHVMHGFEFLKPGGTLTAILPITAESGETKKHVAFRKWAEQHVRWGLTFQDLPAESFRSSGTMVNTVILRLHKSSRA